MNGQESDRVQVAYLFAPEFDCGTIVGLRSFLLAEEGPKVEIAIPSNPPNARLKLTRLVVPYNCTNATVRQPKYNIFHSIISTSKAGIVKVGGEMLKI